MPSPTQRASAKVRQSYLRMSAAVTIVTAAGTSSKVCGWRVTVLTVSLNKSSMGGLSRVAPGALTGAGGALSCGSAPAQANIASSAAAARQQNLKRKRFDQRETHIGASPLDLLLSPSSDRPQRRHATRFKGLLDRTSGRRNHPSHGVARAMTANERSRYLQGNTLLIGPNGQIL